MKEQFCSYEISLKLKELGFDEECFGYYTPMKDWMISTNPKYNSEPHYIGPNWCTEDMKMRFMFVTNTFGDRDSVVKNSEFTKAILNVAVPLWQQTEQWLRDTHNYHIAVYRLNNKWCSEVYDILRQCYITSNALDGVLYDTYEEAREQVILKCIELLKNK